MPRYLLIIAFFVVLIGCGSTPPPFKGFEQRQIAGPGTFSLPRWSPDGRYLAFFDRDRNLHLYDSTSEQESIIAQDVSSFLNWATPDQLSYLKHHLNSTGLTHPIRYDLRVVNRDGGSNKLVAEGIKDAKDFFWLKDERSVLMLLNEAIDEAGENEVFWLDTQSGSKERLVSLQEL